MTATDQPCRAFPKFSAWCGSREKSASHGDTGHPCRCRKESVRDLGGGLYAPGGGCPRRERTRIKRPAGSMVAPPWTAADRLGGKVGVGSLCNKMVMMPPRPSRLTVRWILFADCQFLQERARTPLIARGHRKVQNKVWRPAVTVDRNEGATPSATILIDYWSTPLPPAGNTHSLLPKLPEARNNPTITYQGPPATAFPYAPAPPNSIEVSIRR